MDIWTKIGIGLAFLGLGISLGAAFLPYEWREMPQQLRRAGLAVGALFCIGGIVSPFLLPSETHPDVTLTFTMPQEPSIILLNTGEKSATQIKYGGLFTNIDAPDVHTPLPIPFAAFDFLRPHENSALEPIFSNVAKSGAILPGQRIFGFISVSCPDCARTHIFWVYIVWGQSGWYYELPPGQPVDTRWLYGALPQISKDLSVIAQAVPMGGRIAIKPM